MQRDCDVVAIPLFLSSAHSKKRDRKMDIKQRDLPTCILLLFVIQLFFLSPIHASNLNNDPLKVIVPNAKIVVQPGDSYPITWIPGTGDAVDLFLSTDNGASWTVIAKNSANSGCYNWVVPEDESLHCLIKVSDADDAGIFDTSDTPFTIGRISGPLLQLSNMNGNAGERETLSINLAGNATAFDAFGASLTFNTDHLKFIEAQKGELTGAWIQVSGVENTAGIITLGGFHTSALQPGSIGNLMNLVFEVSSEIENNCSASHIVLSGLVDDAAGMHAYSGTFFMQSCDVRLLGPSTSIRLQAGESHIIKWRGSESAVDLDYSLDDGSVWTSIVANLDDAGCFIWTVPDVTSEACKTRIRDAADPSCFAINEAPIIIGEINQPFIEVTSLAGSAGDNVFADVLLYKSDRKIDAFGLELFYDSAHLSFIQAQKGELTADWIQVTGTENSSGQLTLGGFHTTALPTATSGQLMRLAFKVITDETDECTVSYLELANPVDDISDLALFSGAFTIRQCDINLITPSARVFWEPGTIHPITWQTGVASGAVSLAYQLDSTSDWFPLLSPIEDTGCFQWHLPDLANDNLVIKISDAADESCAQQSSAVLLQLPEPPFVRLSDATGSQGDVATIDVLLQNGALPVDAFGVNVNYDPNHLQFESIEKGDLTAEWIQVGGDLSETGVITLGGFHTASIAQQSNGSLAKINFTILAECAPCDVSHITLTNPVDDLKNIALIDGTFSCPPPCLLGDVNNDGALTPADALCAFEMYVHGTPGPDCASECSHYSADTNCDGLYTPQDALIIFKHYISGEPITCPASLAKDVINADIILTAQIDNPNGQIIVPISATDAQGLNCFGFEISSPPNLIFEKMERSTATQNWIALDAGSRNGHVTIGGFDMTGLEQASETLLFKLYFAIRDGSRSDMEFDIIQAHDQLANIAGKQFHFKAENARPTQFALLQNYPNPFNMITDIEFHLPQASHVALDIYNISGSRVQSLVQKELPAGVHRIKWDGRNENAQTQSSGLYFYTIKAGAFQQTKRMILIK
jgi:hypothetical protein